MATRFHSRRPGAGNESSATGEQGFGEWWLAIAVIALASVGLVASTGSSREPSATPPVTIDRSADILAAIAPARGALERVEAALETLCREPVLMALELEPDCETGVVTLGDPMFGAGNGATLRPEVQEDVRAAIRAYLSRLRRLPALWDSLEAIEFRGHSDPRAVRNPYITNLVGSQQRPIGVLIFLVGPDGLSSPTDREDLERLAIVSGVSYSRPPESCPDESRECYDQWRRVEIRPVLSEAMRRGDWSRTLEEVRRSATRAQAAAGAQPR